MKLKMMNEKTPSMKKMFFKVDLNEVSPFNDNDNSGYGEFQGFGTSLCWWANRVGYSEKMTKLSGEYFFNKEKGLGMTIGRYNVGGGDNVSKDGTEPSDILKMLPNEARFDQTKFEEYDRLKYLKTIAKPHKEHIKRSDSLIPGFAKDVTVIELSDEHTKDYYIKNFDRVDFEAGFAWNYDENSDKNQINVLLEAKKQAKDEFIAEAFSNSPPYFLNYSGCSCGFLPADKDNLRKESYNAFADYMTDVMKIIKDKYDIHFQSADPMNEPYTAYWDAFSVKQEGCHFDQGKSQSDILLKFKEKLLEKGMSDVLICATDETSIDVAIDSYNTLSDEAKNIVQRIDTHAYMGDKRRELKALAIKEKKNLWMSEVDGIYKAGDFSKESDFKNREMSQALGIASAVLKDLCEMQPSAWILWDAIDVHADKNNEFDADSLEIIKEFIKAEEGNSFWGLAIGDHNNENIVLTKKYYGFGQLSRYIRPGMTLVSLVNVGDSNDEDCTDYATGLHGIAAFDKHTKNTSVVITNNTCDGVMAEVDFSDLLYVFDADFLDRFKISVVRTSGSLKYGENWADVTDKCNLLFDCKTGICTLELIPNSIQTIVISQKQEGKYA